MKTLIPFLFLFFIISCQSNNHTDIKNAIEQAYFDLSTNTHDGDFHIYNTGKSFISTIGAIPSLIGLYDTFILEASDIKVVESKPDLATATFTVTLTRDTDIQSGEVIMDLKRIAGKWKLDGAKLLPEEIELRSKI